jgi:acetyl-CoA carboxylase biotin carboxyl carrier protein
MIDIRKLKELVRLMVSSGLTELDLRDSEEQVTLRRQMPGPSGGPPQFVMASPAVVPHHVVAVPTAGAAIAAPSPVLETDDEDGLVRIESPMVGTFYSAANPDSPPFISVGSTVSPETVVCLIEAMKIFNEIKAECSGTVRKVLVKSGDAVEFGQALFLVEPE